MPANAQPSSWGVLRHRGFRLLWTGNLISGCGVWIQSLAIGWLIARHPHAPMLLGLFGFASLAPTLLFSLFGGTLADRFDRRRILFATQGALMLLSLATGALVYWNGASAWHLIVMGGLTGLLLAVNSPAYQAIIPDLVPPEDLTRAIALNSIQFNVARIVGYAAAGIAVARVGEAGCFVLNALTYLAMLYATWRLPRTSSGHRRSDPSPFMARVVEGLSHLRARPDSLRLIVAVGCISLFGLPYFVLLPAFGRDVLGLGAQGLGYLTASVSVGALLGGLLMTRIVARFNKRSLVAAAGTLFWASLLVFAASTHYSLSCLLLVALGFTLVLTISTVNNCLQETTTSEMRGRVMSVLGMAVNGLAPLGSVIAGALAQRTSPALAVAGMALVGFVAMGAVLWRPQNETDSVRA